VADLATGASRVLHPGSRRRAVVAIVTTATVLLVALSAGLLSSTDGGAPVILVTRLSAAIDDAVTGLGGALWWTYAFLLGAVAAFNPCGFALLPAYLGLYLGEGDGRGSSLGSRTRRSLRVAATVAIAFTVLFGAMGAIFGMASSAIARSLPWAGLVVGVLLVLAGGASMAGLSPGRDLTSRLAGSIGRGANESGIRGYAVFGLAYGVASLGCTLPLFLALTGTAVASAGTWAAVAAFVLYGAGMAAALGIVTLVAGIVTFGVLGTLRPASRFVSGVGSVLLLLSGAYVVYYWLSAGRLLLG
jgi:cytochrome c-type biogenesis protein